jgi:hypothetical protein
MKIEFEPIGVIHSPFKTPVGVPIQPTAAEGVRGTVEVREAYRPGLSDLDGFSHVILLYCFHLGGGYRLQVVPFLDTQERGLFATRAEKAELNWASGRRTRAGRGPSVVRARSGRGGRHAAARHQAVRAGIRRPVRGTGRGWLERVGGGLRGRKSDERFT